MVNYDDTLYTVPVPGGTMLPVTVTATLYYQTSSKDYVEFLRDEAIDNSFPTENTMCSRTWTEGPADQSRGQFMFDLWVDLRTFGAGAGRAGSRGADAMRLLQSGLLLVGAIVTANAVAGPPPDFTPHGTQPGLAFSMLEPRDCSDCHSVDAFPVTGGIEFSPQDTWRGSMMANATRDPLFWAALDVANNDAPGVGDYCLRCHTPRVG